MQTQADVEVAVEAIWQETVVPSAGLRRDEAQKAVEALPSWPATASGGDVFEGTSYCHNGVLTTAHSASSHGLPVFVADDGQVYGPGEVEAVRLSTSLGFGYHDRLAAAARAAGYAVSE